MRKDYQPVAHSGRHPRSRDRRLASINIAGRGHGHEPLSVVLLRQLLHHPALGISKSDRYALAILRQDHLLKIEDVQRALRVREGCAIRRAVEWSINREEWYLTTAIRKVAPPLYLRACGRWPRPFCPRREHREKYYCPKLRNQLAHHEVTRSAAPLTYVFFRSCSRRASVRRRSRVCQSL